MAATFVISTTTATFTARVRGTQQQSGAAEQLSLSVYFADDANWKTLLSLVTTKYHVHEPVGGGAIVDVGPGQPGEGTLTIPTLGTVTAICTGLRSSSYLPSLRRESQAEFLITGTWA